MKKTNSKYTDLISEIKKHKSTFAVFIILRAIVTVALAVSLVRRDYESAFVCFLSLILFLLPPFIQKKYYIELPSLLEIIILLFIFAAEILGELQSYYLIFPHWDTILHTTNGFLCAAIGFALVDIFNRSKRFSFSLSPIFLSVVAFCFSMTVGVLWEFFEFGCDVLFLTDMQKDTVLNQLSSVLLNADNLNKSVVIKDITSVAVNGNVLPVNGYLDIGLYDTMEDMFVNFIGALIFCIIGYFYLKKRGKKSFASNFIPKVKTNSEIKKEQSKTE